ncbi:unnamed protein product [Paramecium sonneborni]|uniref:Uncharacterized protein n=1 Tax=Paramecium sonneborni TaxID=65129 RepID=A0A8S1RGC9_9CILI|nr:unnamed protein product [Paramecium sonneborni]
MQFHNQFELRTKTTFVVCFFHLNMLIKYFLDFLKLKDKISQTEFYSFLLYKLCKYNDTRETFKQQAIQIMKLTYTIQTISIAFSLILRDTIK